MPLRSTQAGSLVHREVLRDQFGTLVHRFVQRTRKAKLSGKGLGSCVEFDPFVIRLVGMLHDVDRRERSLWPAMVTYLQTLDAALRAADRVAWHRNWTLPLEPSKPGLIGNMAHAMFNQVSVDEAADKAHTRNRHAVYDAIFRRSGLLGRLQRRPDGTAPAVTPPELDEAPPRLAEPLWSQPTDLVCSDMLGWDRRACESIFEAIGYSIVMGYDAFWRSAGRLLEGAPTSLDHMSLEEQASWIFGEIQDERFFLAPYVDFEFGEDAECVLRQLLAVSRVMGHTMGWQRTGPSNLHISVEWIIEAMIVGDQMTLDRWAHRCDDVLKQRRFDGPGTKAVCQAAAAWIRNDRARLPRVLPASATLRERTLVNAFRSLLDGDGKKLAESATQLAQTYSKYNPYSRFEPIRMLKVSPIALALVRNGRRAAVRGVAVGADVIPPEMVAADDPREADPGWLPLPGVEVMAAYDDLRWPAAVLNEPIVRFQPERGPLG